VTLFLDLTHPEDGLPPYANAIAGRARRTALPTHDFEPPSHAVIGEALRLIDAEQAAGGTTYVHCWGGIGRTGTVIGCWLVPDRLERGDGTVGWPGPLAGGAGGLP